jgi:hypothetical protein
MLASDRVNFKKLNLPISHGWRPSWNFHRSNPATKIPNLTCRRATLLGRTYFNLPNSIGFRQAKRRLSQVWRWSAIVLHVPVSRPTLHGSLETEGCKPLCVSGAVGTSSRYASQFCCRDNRAHREKAKKELRVSGRCTAGNATIVNNADLIFLAEKRRGQCQDRHNALRHSAV